MKLKTKKIIWITFMTALFIIVLRAILENDLAISAGLQLLLIAIIGTIYITTTFIIIMGEE